MSKLYLKFIVILMIVLMFVFGMSTNVFAGTKPSTNSEKHYVIDKGKVDRVKNNGNGNSHYASVPDADIMWLLGPALIFLGLLGKRRIKV